MGIFSFICCVLYIVVCPFLLFLLAIVLSILLRLTVSDYLFDIFKLLMSPLLSRRPSPILQLGKELASSVGGVLWTVTSIRCKHRPRFPFKIYIYPQFISNLFLCLNKHDYIFYTEDCGRSSIKHKCVLFYVLFLNCLLSFYLNCPLVRVKVKMRMVEILTRKRCNGRILLLCQGE